MRVLPLVVVTFLIAGGIANADRTATGKPTLDISGNYASNWGAVSLRQNGNHVRGVYDTGRLDGDLEGNMLRYTWRESGGASGGKGIWVIASNGELIGTWGTSDDLSGGGWRLTPAKQAALAN